MGTTIDKLKKVQETKAAIKQAIINKGVEIPDGTIFADYPNKISEITSGEGSGDSTTYVNPDFYEIRTNGGTNYNNLFRDYNGFSLDIGNWDTSKVTTMNDMFANCRFLKLNLSNWNMTNVSNTDNMFRGCGGLRTLRLDNCNEDTIRKIIESRDFPTGGTRKIYCLEENVANLAPPNGWEFVDAVTGEVIVLEEPEFYRPGYYKGRDIEEATTMVTSEHDDLSEMFQECENLRTINNISEWDTSNVTNMDNMFKRCNSLVSLDLSNWVVSKVESMHDMIQGCESLVSVNASNWDVSSVTDMWGMFADCRSLEELDLSGWDMTNVSNTTYMFNNSSNLRTLRLDDCDKETIRKIITVDSFPTGAITGVTRKIFCKESEAAGLTAPTNWVFEYVEEPIPLYVSGQFSNKDDITEVRTMVNNTHTSLRNMFSCCFNLATVNTQDWDTSNVTDMGYMFNYCHKLTSLDLSAWNTSKVTNMGMMFINCSNLTTVDLSNFDMTNVTNYAGMFGSCYELHTVRLDNCNSATINKIISALPTGTVNGETRKIYCKQSNVTGLTAPSGWVFEYVTEGDEE